jgi:benzoyl-CoA reductase/2-hydroxyglutaryl-CoA dehydratase subunit BcrC/BadD/HgdB
MQESIYKEFLQLAGFDQEEIATCLPEWIVAAKKLGLTAEDMHYAVREWLPKHWNLELAGIRKCIGLYIREVMEITKLHQHKQNGIKVIFGSLPALPFIFQAIKRIGGNEVFVSYPDICLVTVLGSFFHKPSVFIEKVDSCTIHAGCSHCGLVKTRLGAKMTQLIPSPDVIWSWGIACNEAPKMDELINCYLNTDWNAVFSSVPHDTYLGEVEEENEERCAYIAAQIRDGQKQIEKVTGIVVSEEQIRSSLEFVDRFMRKVHYLHDLACHADPQPLSGNELSLIGQMMTLPFNTGFAYVEEALDLTIKEVEMLIAQKKGPLPAGAPRLGCYFIPFCVPWVERMFRENGVNLSFSTFYAATRKLMKPTKYQDPYEIMAAKMLRMPGIVNIAYELDLTFEIIKELHPDAMLQGFYNFDRWMGVHHRITTKGVEEEMKIPHFYIEGNMWDDRAYRTEDLKTRVESISHFLKMNKMIS